MCKGVRFIEQVMENRKKNLVIGILAHVDAGKTTLSESMLYICGKIKKAGRVDHGDAFLDTYQLEKERGITIFSKQAMLEIGDTCVSLLDTPGHADFSAEMERTLQVLDYAILVISGADGVQGHTLTLWRLLDKYQVPVFLFINKMDQNGTDREKLLADITGRLSAGCLDFDPARDQEEFQEELAMVSEELLEKYTEEGEIPLSDIQRYIRERRLFPCFFGSALKPFGVEEFLKGLETYAAPSAWQEEFGARVFKIARDEKGNRLTYMKVTGGKLSVKMSLQYRKAPGNGADGSSETEELVLEEKTDQIRIYSGSKYEAVQEVLPGMVCAVTGLSGTFPGQGLGTEPDGELPVLEPVLNYRIILPAGTDPHVMLRKLSELQEEDPALHIEWESGTGEIHAMLMGEVQIEVLKRLVWDRFHVAVDFGEGQVVYKETIASPVEGVGHFEPLRHYAEVHLLLEPGERGTGIQLFTACSEDILDRNWQRLIFTHLLEKEHKGVLTGAPVTDLQITLLTGRAHIKHTEGGDFRQATYRALRQGLMKARNILLEPYYEFTMELPADALGRAMTDIQKMQGSFQPPEQQGDICTLKGTAPVSKMRGYQTSFTAYTRGMGRLFCSLAGYQPCAEQEEVVRGIGYDPEADLDNPTGSVFCAHGAGFIVPWYQVEEYMHLEGMAGRKQGEETDSENGPFYGADSSPPGGNFRPGRGTEPSYADEEELLKIFERTFGPVKRQLPQEQKRVFRSVAYEEWKPSRKKKPQKEYLLVDGYNIIFAWEELRELSKKDIRAAQGKLMDILSDYQGSRGMTLILVFDAYKVEGHREEVLTYHNIYIVYTKEAETADQYIEKTAHQLGKDNVVTVATSDALEQIIILGQGARRLSARGLKEEVELASAEVKDRIQEGQRGTKAFLSEHMKEDVQEYLKQLREKN